MEGLRYGKEEVNIIVVYNKGKIKEVIEELRGMTDEWAGNEKVILIVGDFNVRVGRWQKNKEASQLLQGNRGNHKKREH